MENLYIHTPSLPISIWSISFFVSGPSSSHSSAMVTDLLLSPFFSPFPVSNKWVISTDLYVAPFSDPEWRVWLNNHWRSGSRAASPLPAPHLGDILSPVTETSGTEGSAVGRRSGSAGSWWNEDRVMKAWPMASAALPYVSPNANCPLFKQLFHLDICKCVYKYCLINIALQFVQRKLWVVFCCSCGARQRRSTTSFNEHARTWQQLMESWGTRCEVVKLGVELLTNRKKETANTSSN